MRVARGIRHLVELGLIFLALAIALAFIPAAYPEPGFAPHIQEDSPSHSSVQEDDATWDCRTMGNRVCGVTP